jgi:hypothetical protein
MTYRIIFWGTSPHSIKILRLKKKVIRIITGSKKRESCMELFKEMKIMPFCSQYIPSLMLYVVNNRHLFTNNSEIHNIVTRQNNLYPPSNSLTKVQKGAYFSGIKIYNHLPIKIKELSDDQKPFRSALKRFLYSNSFYSVEEYFSYKCN